MDPVSSGVPIHHSLSQIIWSVQGSGPTEVHLTLLTSVFDVQRSFSVHSTTTAFLNPKTFRRKLSDPNLASKSNFLKVEVISLSLLSIPQLVVSSMLKNS